MSQIIKFWGHHVRIRILSNYCCRVFKYHNLNYTTTTHTCLNPRISVRALRDSRSFSTGKGSKENSPQTVGTNLNAEKNGDQKKLSQRARLKQAVRDYGATIVVFHVTISLASLGLCYMAISSGVDAVKMLSYLGFSESVVSSKIATEGSTFVIAYAMHKVFAPVRIAITLSTAPFIVRYLRRINWIKPPKV